MALLTGDEIIEIAVRLEERGEAFYAAAADNATTAEVRELFLELAEQEVHHKRAFQNIGRDLLELALSPDQWDQFQAYTNALLQQSFFTKPEGALGQAAKAMEEQEAIQAALSFEKETLLFFHELRDLVRGPGQQVVGRIIDEEKRHIQRLSAQLTAA